MNNLELKKIRKELRLTQEKLAKELNVSKSLVQKWESGERTPDDFIISLIRKIHKNAQNTTSLKEPEATYTVNYDEKITNLKEEIEKLKKEIEKWEIKLKEDPEKKETYQKYISSYEEQIYLHNEIINITLEAKRDFLESKKEENL